MLKISLRHTSNQGLWQPSAVSMYQGPFLCDKHKKLATGLLISQQLTSSLANITLVLRIFAWQSHTFTYFNVASDPLSTVEVLEMSSNNVTDDVWGPWSSVLKGKTFTQKRGVGVKLGLGPRISNSKYFLLSHFSFCTDYTNKIKHVNYLALLVLKGRFLAFGQSQASCVPVSSLYARLH